MKTFNTDEIAEIEKMAGLCFTPEQIAIVLQVDATEFRKEYNKDLSEVYLHYQRGALMHETEVRNSVYQLAKGGSSTAQQQYMSLLKDRNNHLFKTK
ncbi:MAG: hypothetical protein EOM59_13245 [Clostridia bacterium]|nr:hypothetical protein [Clostridia bacterium]